MGRYAEQSEMIDEEAGQHLTKNDAHQGQSRTKVGHEDDIGRNIHGTECSSDEVPGTQPRTFLIRKGHFKMSGTEEGQQEKGQSAYGE